MKLLTEPMDLKNRVIQVGGSLGVAVFPEDAGDMESLCICADLRMYEDKRANAGDGGEVRCENCDRVMHLERRTELGMVQ